MAIDVTMPLLGNMVLPTLILAIYLLHLAWFALTLQCFVTALPDLPPSAGISSESQRGHAARR